MAMIDVEVVEAAAGLAAEAAAAAPATEENRRLPATLVAGMADAGVYRLLVPEAAGGLEAHPAVLLEAVEALARGDGAAGWCAAICATSGLLAGYLPPAAASEVYAQPRAISGGVFAPKGRAVPDGDGFRVTGRWPFASGCEDCTWLMGGSVVDDGDGGVRKLQNGMPDVRLMLAPAGEVAIHDTWHVMGLRGTGSHDIEFDGVHVPAERSASLFSDRPVATGPLYAFPLFGLLALAIGAVGLGIARGALDDIEAIAGGKTPTGSRRTLAERPATQSEVARAEASLRAARALLLESVHEAWASAVERGEVPVERRAALRMAATHAATAGASVTAAAYGLGGGSAVYERSALPRRFRDANVATHHMLVGPATWELTGRILLGLGTDVTQL
jgi:alkylation response protein AidB-like acyl-CoA dehydrogenase